MAKAGDGKKRSEARRTTRRVSKRLSQQEWESFEARAAEAGFKDPQDYLSCFILGEVRIKRIARTQWTVLLGNVGKIGSNINQIARRLNSDRFSNITLQELKVIEDGLHTIAAVGRQLRDFMK